MGIWEDLVARVEELENSDRVNTARVTELERLDRENAALIADLANENLTIASKVDSLEKRLLVLEGSTPTPNPEPTGFLYVSASGSDDNDGVSPTSPLNTISAANAKLPNFKGVLFERGGVFPGVFGRWRTTDYSGKTIGAYGTGVKPVIKTGGHPFIDFIDAIVLKDIVFKDLVLDSDGAKGNIFRWLGGGENITIENCDFISGQITIQNYNKLGLKNFTLKSNLIKGAWNIAGQSHAQGLYADEIIGLNIVDNIFDHNGWNETQPGGEATMFNHNMYLSSCSDVVVKGNKIFDASSIGIKFRSDIVGGSKNILVEGNHFKHGEIGISIGGNTQGPDRFQNVSIVNNIFDAIGATNPTNRNFSWGIDLDGVTNGKVMGNEFVNAPNFSNYVTIQESAFVNDVEIQGDTPEEPVPPVGMKMGINLHGLSTWSRELVFSNVMMHGSEWRLCSASNILSPWSTSGSIPPLSAQGLPTGVLPFGSNLTIKTDIFCDNGMKYPVGTYKLAFEGNATVQLKCGSKVQNFVAPGGDFVVTTRDRLGINLAIIKNDPANPIRNLKLMSPTVGISGLEPAFVNFMKPFNLVRFMDFMETNNSKVTDNAVMDYAIAHPENGAPINSMLSLVNALKITPWFCLPHMSTDNYNRMFAAAVKASNIPVVYVEYSNETWNGMFSQTGWLKSRSVNGGANWADVTAKTAEEMVRRFRVWEEVFGSERDRLKFVVAGQNGNFGVASGLTKAVAALGFKFDVVSSAPYWYVSSADKSSTTSLDAVMTKTLEYLRTKNIPQMKSHVDLAKTYSTQFGKKVEFLTYECGQHLVPDTGQAYTAAYYAAQTDPRMKQAYKEFIAAAKSQGVDGLCFFNSCQLDTRYGCWGLIQDSFQDPMTAIKYQAIVESI